MFAYIFVLVSGDSRRSPPKKYTHVYNYVTLLIYIFLVYLNAVLP